MPRNRTSSVSRPATSATSSPAAGPPARPQGWLLRALVAAAFAALLTACGGQDGGTSDGPPAAPSAVTVQPGPGSITVSWTHDGVGVESFDVLREASGASSLRAAAFETIASVPADRRSFVDEDVDPAVSYRYGVAARGRDGAASTPSEQPGDPVAPDAPLAVAFSLDWEAAAARGDLRAVAVAPNGRHIAVGAFEPDVLLVDRETETVVREYDTSSTISSLAYDPDGDVLAAGGSRLWLFDAASGDVLWEGSFGDDPDSSREWFRSLAISPDGTRVAAAGEEGTLRVWTVATGAIELTVDVNTVASSTTAAIASAPDFEREPRIDEDGSVPAGLSTSQSTVRLAAVAFSPDGTLLATGGSDGGVHTWNASTGASVRSYEAFGFSVADVLFTPDGTRLVATGGGGSSGAVAWTLDDGVVDTRFGDEPVATLTMPSSGDMLIGGATSGEIVVYDADTGAQTLALTAHDPKLGDLALDTDEAGVVSVGRAQDGTVAVWSLPDGSEQSRVQIAGGLRNVVGAGDGARVVTLSDGGELMGWDAATGSKLFEAASGSLPEAMVTSPDGDRVAVGAREGFDVFDSATGELLLAARPLDGFARVASLAYSPDGSTIAIGGSGDLHLVDAASGTLLNSVTASPDGATLTAVAFSSDGAYVLSGEGYRPGTARLAVWDADTLASVATRDAHDGTLAALAFDASGDRLISAGRNPSRIWDTSDWSVAADIDTGGTASAAAFSSDGSRIVLAGYGMDELLVLDATSLGVLGRLPIRTHHFAYDAAADRVAVMNEGTVQAYTMTDR